MTDKEICKYCGAEKTAEQHSACEHSNNAYRQKGNSLADYPALEEDFVDGDALHCVGCDNFVSSINAQGLCSRCEEREK